MQFEWDEQKNQVNLRKHGLSFADAQEIFESPMITKLDPRADYQEDRYIGIGILRQRIVVIVFTEFDNELIRIISLRKALKHERSEFERYIKNRLG